MAKSHIIAKVEIDRRFHQTFRLNIDGPCDAPKRDQDRIVVGRVSHQFGLRP